MKKVISLCILFASCSVYGGNELATLHSDWFHTTQKDYNNFQSLLTKPLSPEALLKIKIKYDNNPSYKVPINHLTNHLKTPDGKKKEMQEALAMRLALKEQLNTIPTDLMLFLLFGLEGYRNETLAQYLQRNMKLLQFIKTVDAIKRIEQEFESRSSKSQE
jgi:hypothetical protein